MTLLAISRTPPVLFYGEFSQFHSDDLRKHKKNSDIAGGKLNQFNQFNQFNGTVAEQHPGGTGAQSYPALILSSVI